MRKRDSKFTVGIFSFRATSEDLKFKFYLIIFKFNLILLLVPPSKRVCEYIHILYTFFMNIVYHKINNKIYIFYTFKLWLCCKFNFTNNFLNFIYLSYCFVYIIYIWSSKCNFISYILNEFIIDAKYFLMYWCKKMQQLWIQFCESVEIYWW